MEEPFDLERGIKMTMEILPQAFTVCQVEALPVDVLETEFCFFGKTDQELSLVCPTEVAPKQTLEREDGWRGIRIAGKLEFSLIGILAELSGVLAKEHIGIFAVSTYDTDYILLKGIQLEQAVNALREHGYVVQNLA